MARFVRADWWWLLLADAHPNKLNSICTPFLIRRMRMCIYTVSEAERVSSDTAQSACVQFEYDAPFVFHLVSSSAFFFLCFLPFGVRVCFASSAAVAAACVLLLPNG